MTRERSIFYILPTYSPTFVNSLFVQFSIDVLFMFLLICKSALSASLPAEAELDPH